MPEYCFRCETHGVIKIKHNMTVPHPTICPLAVEDRKCGLPLTRVYSEEAANIAFSGSGFYSTDAILSEPTPDEKLEAKLQARRNLS